MQLALFAEPIFTDPCGAARKIKIYPGERILLCRGRPVLIDANNDANAVEPGYFPLSGTGYYSGCCVREWTAEVMEKIACEADAFRDGKIRWARKELKESHDQRMQQLEGDIIAGEAYYAPDGQRQGMLKLAYSCFHTAGWEPGLHAVEEAMDGRWASLRQSCHHVMISSRQGGVL